MAIIPNVKLPNILLQNIDKNNNQYAVIFVCGGYSWSQYRALNTCSAYIFDPNALNDKQCILYTYDLNIN